MKNRIVLISALSLLLTACGTDAGMTPTTDSQISEETTQASGIVRVTIMEISGNTLVVKPVDGSWELQSSDSFTLSADYLNDSIQPQVGMTLEITYDGSILETYPSFFSGIEKVTVLDDTAEISESEVNDTMQLKIASTEVPVTWEDNESVAALKALLPLTIEMSMYGGFEQVGSIGQSIVRNDVQTVTEPGDIVLYSGNQIVVFYGSNSWSYTRLGHVELSEEELTELLSNGDVTVTITNN